MLALNYTIIPGIAVIQVGFWATCLRPNASFLSATHHPKASTASGLYAVNSATKRSPYWALAGTRDGER